MKVFFCLLFLIFGYVFGAFNAISKSYQSKVVVPVTIFYGADSKVTTKDKAFIIRTASIDTLRKAFVGQVEDVFLDGSPAMRVFYNEQGKEGKYQRFYSNKQLHVQGQYKANKPIGSWRYHYPDGKLKQVIEFLPNEKYSVRQYFDDSGRQLLKDGTGDWKATMEARRGTYFGNTYIKSQWKNGLKDGRLELSRSRDTPFQVEYFEQGEFKKGEIFDKSGKTIIEVYSTPKAEDFSFKETAAEEMEKLDVGVVLGTKARALKYILQKEHLKSKDYAGIVYTEKDSLDKRPEFEGGTRNMFRYLSDKFRIPNDYPEVGIEGALIISFIVRPDGSTADIRITKSLYPSFDVEAIRVVANMPLWEPGILNGKPVSVRCSVPYRIVIR